MRVGGGEFKSPLRHKSRLPWSERFGSWGVGGGKPPAIGPLHRGLERLAGDGWGVARREDDLGRPELAWSRLDDVSALDCDQSDDGGDQGPRDESADGGWCADVGSDSGEDRCEDVRHP